MGEARYLDARRAAAELGVSLATLYAYVSRGMIRSEAADGSGRRRRYRAEDVRRLKERKERRRDPDRAVEGALHWGTPVMESAITLITGDGLYYRGRDVVALAVGSTIEEVAALIWTGDPAKGAELFAPDPPELSPRIRTALGDDLPPVETFQVLLSLAGAEDPAAYDLRPAAVARTGARVLRLMVTAVAGDKADKGGLARTLQGAWIPHEPRAAALLDSAFVLCADHELPVSTFAARCVASSEATPYAVVIAGLSAMGGVKHGGQVELVETFLQEVEAVGDARAAISARLRRGDRIPGFGHSLYPGGDPRGAKLLRTTRAAYPDSPGVALCAAVADEALVLMDERATVDFGLVTLARALGLPRGGAVTLFALGRTVGWIGHAIEQYAGGSLIRPRTRYVGEQPK